MSLNPSLASRASVQALVVLAIAVPAILLVPGAAALFAMLASSLYTVSSGIGLVFRPRYLSALGAFIFFWLIVFFTLLAVADAAAKGMRDDAMVFLLPFTLFLPVALGASFLHWLRRRHAKAANAAGNR